MVRTAIKNVVKAIAGWNQQRDKDESFSTLVGEFAPIDMTYGVYAVLAPMIFLQVIMNSKDGCLTCVDDTALEPEQYIEVQVQTILNGLRARPAGTTSN